MANTKETQKELRKHFIETIRETLAKYVSPTPYLEIVDADESAKQVFQVNFLRGHGRRPKVSGKSTEVTTLDVEIAAMYLPNLRLLHEGVTGVGKTFNSQLLFGTVMGPDGYKQIRLTGGVLGVDALSMFTKSTNDENGAPVVQIDESSLDKYGAIFIDEISRNPDPNQTMQVLDAEINIGGKIGQLRIPIPGTDRFKKPIIVSAMNPPTAEYNGSIPLDLAGENRFVRFIFPDCSAEDASSQLDYPELTPVQKRELHEQFWKELLAKIGSDKEYTAETWRELYPIITDPAQFDVKLNGRQREFLDVAIGYVSQDPQKIYKRNTDIMRDYGIDPAFLFQENNDYQRVKEALQKLKHGFVRRDINKIHEIAKTIAFVKGFKGKTYDMNISLNELSAALGVILESKVVAGEEPGSLMTIVNDARAAYEGLYELKHTSKLQQNDKPNPFFGQPIYGGPDGVPAKYGIRQAVLWMALEGGCRLGYEGFKNTMALNIGFLNTNASVGPATAAIKSRILADFAVIQGLAEEEAIKPDMEKLFAAQNKKGSFERLKSHYLDRKQDFSLYAHRLPSVFLDDDEE